MAKSQTDKILTGLAGEYYVAAELCRRGYVASLTLKNFPQVDVFALHPETHVPIAIQVKAVRASRERPMFFTPADAGSYKGFFVFVVVSNPPDSGYETFVVPAADVQRLSEKARAEYVALHPGVKPDQPLMLGLSELEPYRDKWDCLFSVNGGHD